MKHTAIVIALTVGLAAFSSMGQGQAPPQGQGERPQGEGRRGGGFRGGGALMGALDLNQDGTLDSREIQASPMSLKKLDANKDFKLTPEELGMRGRGGGGDMTARMMSMDQNGDGKLTADELPGRMSRMLERMDANGDGAVDKAEMDAMQQRFREGGFGGRGARGGPEGGPPPGRPQPE